MYSVLPLEPGRYREALAFVCREFVAGSVLHRATSIAADDYLGYLGGSFYTTADECLSFIAIEATTGNIVGCLLAGDFCASSAPGKITPPSLQPIRALLEELEAKYQRRTTVLAGSSLLVDIAVVSSNVRRQGLYARLRQAAHTLGALRGFTIVIGELSSAATQGLCVNKLGHRVACEIEYRSFAFEGRYPFRCIDSPKSIQLVEGLLT
jgi:hypothetical protein